MSSTPLSMLMRSEMARSAKVLPATRDERSNDRSIICRRPAALALAQDRAFSFMYPHLLRQWRRAGAEIIPFHHLPMRLPMNPHVVWCREAIRNSMPALLASAHSFRAVFDIGQTFHSHPR